MLKNRRITLAVTGGIAAYKTCELVRGLIRAGADVRCAMSAKACEFVGPLTFEALTGHPVAAEGRPYAESAMAHIDLTRGADLLVVMPATANVIAKAACGIADELISSTILARRCPVVFVPAMNCHMWNNPATQRNVAQLRADGAFFIGPAEGAQACGDTGAGRMTEPEDVLDLLDGIFTPKCLAGRRVIVTAGPTYERIDDVRGITNRSSGRQGFAVARAARDAGADVTLVAGPCALRTPAGVRRIDVVSAVEMGAQVKAVLEREGGADLFVGVAAVADWRVANAKAGKIKKGEGTLEGLRFEENPDILASVARRGDVKVSVGFAAEAGRLEIETAARDKCVAKGADMIVGNIASAALGSDTNTVLFVTPKGCDACGPAPKSEVAREIIVRAARLIEEKETQEGKH
jgi:phosphopantothenoylcysteine decarboxylase / phosphopantothenate---cysteine ligase